MLFRPRRARSQLQFLFGQMGFTDQFIGTGTIASGGRLRVFIKVQCTVDGRQPARKTVIPAQPPLGLSFDTGSHTIK